MPYPFVSRGLGKYTFAQMLLDMDSLVGTYPNLVSIVDIGTTYRGNPLRVMKVGTGKRNVFVKAAAHAREYITMKLVMCMFDDYLNHYTTTPDTMYSFTSELTNLWMREQIYLNITNSATSDGNINLTINGVSHDIAVVTGETPIEIINKIKITEYEGWTLNNTSKGDDWVLIQATTGSGTTVVFDGGITGVIGEITVTQGADNPTTMSKGITYTWKYDIKKMLDNITFHVLPCFNPDGVCIQQGVDPMPEDANLIYDPTQEYYTASIGSNSLSQYKGKMVKDVPELADYLDDCYPWSSWKGNAKGVDAHYNFPTNFNTYNNGQNERASEYYKGDYAAQSEEVVAFIKYFKKIKFEAFLGFHSQWQKLLWLDAHTTYYRKVVEPLIKNELMWMTGYNPTGSTTERSSSILTYIREEYGIPAVIIETCPQEYPYRHYPDSKWESVYVKVKATPLAFGQWVLDNTTDKEISLLSKPQKEAGNLNTFQKFARIFTNQKLAKELLGKLPSGNAVYNGNAKHGTAGYVVRGGKTDGVLTSKPTFEVVVDSELNTEVFNISSYTDNGITAASTFVRQSIEVKPQTYYAFSVRAKKYCATDATWNAGYIYLSGQSANAGHLNGNTIYYTDDYRHNCVIDSKPLTNEWQTFECNFYTAPDEYSVFFNVSNNGVDEGGTGDIYFCEVTLIEGATIPDLYKPSEKDSLPPTSGNLIFNGCAQLGNAGWVISGAGGDSTLTLQAIKNTPVLNGHTLQAKLATPAGTPVTGYVRQMVGEIKPSTWYSYYAICKRQNTDFYIYWAGQDASHTNQYQMDYQYLAINTSDSGTYTPEGEYFEVYGSFKTDADVRSLYVNLTVSGAVGNSYVDFSRVTLVEGKVHKSVYNASYKDSQIYTCATAARPQYLPYKGVQVWDSDLEIPVYFAGTALSNSTVWRNAAGVVV